MSSNDDQASQDMMEHDPNIINPQNDEGYGDNIPTTIGGTSGIQFFDNVIVETESRKLIRIYNVHIYIHLLSFEFRQASQIETIPLKELNEGEETHRNGYSRKTNGASSSAAWSSGTVLYIILPTLWKFKLNYGLHILI